MVSRCKYQNSSDIGAYARMTNKYILLPSSTSEHFTSVFEDVLGDQFCFVRSNIAGTAIVGRLTCGNSNGLLVPLTTTDSELKAIREELPEGIQVRRIPERFSALGNVIACNDNIALVHPELDPDTLEAIRDVLLVDVFPTLIAGEPLVGSYSMFTNRGGIASPLSKVEELEELSSQLGIRIESATVNRGSGLVSAGACGNDFSLFCGWDTTALEFANLTRIFKIDDNQSKKADNVGIDEFVFNDFY